MTGDTGLKTLLELRNALILNVKDPTPGTWVIRLSAHGAHTVRVTGLSSLDFVHGFSLKPTLSLRDTVPQPTRGKSSPVDFNKQVSVAPVYINKIIEMSNKKADLSQRLPRDAPDIWVP